MKIRILGCGGSFGSPVAWNRNGNIDIKNKRNFRTRSSLLIEINNTKLLIDTSPDLRQQLYDAKCTNIDAVIFTHNHADHTSGLPDMRAFSIFNQKKTSLQYGNWRTPNEETGEHWRTKKEILQFIEKANLKIKFFDHDGDICVSENWNKVNKILKYYYAILENK